MCAIGQWEGSGPNKPPGRIQAGIPCWFGDLYLAKGADFDAHANIASGGNHEKYYLRLSLPYLGHILVQRVYFYMEKRRVVTIACSVTHKARC